MWSWWGLEQLDCLRLRRWEMLVFRFTLLEARDRIGGRIFTLLDPKLCVPIELGAEFIHGRPPETWICSNAGRCKSAKSMVTIGA